MAQAPQASWLAVPTFHARSGPDTIPPSKGGEIAMALTYVFSGLSKVHLYRVTGKSALRFHLVFGSSPSQTETVQFEVAAEAAAEIDRALQKVLNQHGWHPHPPPRGRPTLTIVSSDDASKDEP